MPHYRNMEIINPNVLVILPSAEKWEAVGKICEEYKLDYDEVCCEII